MYLIVFFEISYEVIHLKKKVCIITITDYNFGNRLQHYAVTSLLKKEHFSVCSLRNYGNNLGFKLNKSMLYNLKNGIKLYIRIILGAITKTYRRYWLFAKFNFNNKISWIGKKRIIKNINRFDFIVCGSDQIWNPYFFPDLFCNMAGFIKDKKKIAIAPSVGIDKIDDYQKDEFRKYINDFDYLSCREEAGSKIIEELCNKSVSTILDPTLMITPKEWDKLLKKPSFGNKLNDFILVYFLGNMSDEYKEKINKISKKFSLTIVDISNHYSEFSKIGPSEFLWLIKNSSIVITDSYHGSIFSYIFDRPLKIFKRVDDNKSMDSRFDTLIDKLKINNCLIEENLNLDKILDANYDKSHLEHEQILFDRYFREAISRNE